MIDYLELAYGVALCGGGVIVLIPLFRRMIRTHKLDRTARRMNPKVKLSTAELSELRLGADLDTHVIERGTVTKAAVGVVTSIAPTLRRQEIQPKRHRYNSELDAPRRARAELAIEQAAAEPPR